MATYSCVIQAGQAAAAMTAVLEAGLRRIGQDHFDDPDDITIEWEAVEPGYMFTEGAPSTSSIVVRAVPADITLEVREAFMRDVCDLWTRETGCTDHEIVVAVFPAT